MAKTILIADDNDDLRSLIGYQLQMRGYRILTASDGFQAVKICQSERPDLVIMDIMMPGKDGTEAGAEIKSDPKTMKIPIIYLTSLLQDSEGRESDSEDTGRAAGLSLPKSIPMEFLVRKIEQVLSESNRGQDFLG